MCYNNNKKNTHVFLTELEYSQSWVDGGTSFASWKVRRPLETKTFVFLLSRDSRRGSLDNLLEVVLNSHSSISSSWSNLPPEILIRLLKITSMVIAYIFDMQSPGITKDSLLEVYRQACNMAIIAVFKLGEVNFIVSGCSITNNYTYR